MDLDFRKKIAWFAGLLLIFTATFALGQGIVSGSISGTVQDPQNAVVVGASVTAKAAATNQESKVTTNDNGYFSFRSIPIGIYSLTIDAAGFRKLTITNIVVSVSKDTNVGIQTLSIGTEEVVNVEGTAPLVESTTSQVTASFDAAKTSGLPVGGGFDQLAFFTPGVATAGDNGFSNNNGADLSVNGQRGRNNNFQIDGQSNNDNSVAGPSIFVTNQDVIAEFNVITNSFGVEYGRNSGSVVNYVTKSGGNEFHGTLYEYYTGNFADSYANQEKSTVFGFCTAGQAEGAEDFPGQEGGCSRPDPISRYVENRFGGTIGGPIVPDKIWFFGGYMEDRVRATGAASTSGTNVTPTPTGLAQLQAAFPGNVAVQALTTFGPWAVSTGNPQILGAVTPITVSDGVDSADVDFAAVTRNVPSLYDEYEVNARADFQITDKDRFFTRYIFEQSILTGATGRFAAGAWVDIPARGQQIALDWTRTWSPRLVNQVRFSFSRAGFGFEGGSFPDCTRSGILTCPTGVSFQSPDISFGIQNNLPQGRLINVSSWQDNGSLVMGRHTFKFGGEYSRQRSPAVFLPNINGTYTFGDFDSFLADTPVQVNLADGPTNFPFKEQDASLYFGDDWRIKDNLTLNLGVRWEFTQQAVNLLAQLTRINQAGANPFWDTSLPETVTTLPFIPNDRNNFGPNIGFAWTPRIWTGLFGEDKTVIRGGYRISYDPAYYNIFLNMATAAPVVNAGVVTGATCSAAGACLPTTGFTGADVQALLLPFIPRGVNPGTRLGTRVTDDFHNPYTQQWSLGIQRQIGSKVAAEVRYVGNHTVGNFQTINGNPRVDLLAADFPDLVPAGVTACADPLAPGFASGRANCDFTNLRLRSNSAFSIYHGMQSELRIQSWHGLTAQFGYTWSKTMDNVSEIFSTGAGATTVAGAQDPFDVVAAERSESGLSFPHVFTALAIYDLPWFRNQEGAIGKLLGGFQINTTYRYTSGQLWTPFSDPGDNTYCQNSFDVSFFGITTCRPFIGNAAAAADTVGQCTDAGLADCGLVNFYTGAPVSASDVHWIFNDDEAAFFFGTPYGNARRNPGVRGQAVNTVNLALFKSTKISERVAFRLEAQVYNLFNHQWRGVPHPYLWSGNFDPANGVIGSFGNNFFNTSGGINPDGSGGSTNATLSGIGRRRMILGARLTF